MHTLVHSTGTWQGIGYMAYCSSPIRNGVTAGSEMDEARAIGTWMWAPSEYVVLVERHLLIVGVICAYSVSCPSILYI